MAGFQWPSVGTIAVGISLAIILGIVVLAVAVN